MKSLDFGYFEWIYARHFAENDWLEGVGEICRTVESAARMKDCARDLGKSFENAYGLSGNCADSCADMDVMQLFEVNVAECVAAWSAGSDKSSGVTHWYAVSGFASGHGHNPYLLWGSLSTQLHRTT